MTTGDVVYSLRFSLIKILPEPGFDLGSTAGESCVLTARLHMLIALEKAQGGEPLKKVSREYGVPFRTLHRHLNEAVCMPGTVQLGQYLTMGATGGRTRAGSCLFFFVI